MIGLCFKAFSITSVFLLILRSVISCLFVWYIFFFSTSCFSIYKSINCRRLCSVKPNTSALQFTRPCKHNDSAGREVITKPHSGNVLCEIISFTKSKNALYVEASSYPSNIIVRCFPSLLISHSVISVTNGISSWKKCSTSDLTFDIFFVLGWRKKSKNNKILSSSISLSAHLAAISDDKIVFPIPGSPSIRIL